MSKLYQTKDDFPPYYHPVTIFYTEKGNPETLKERAWLAVDDDNRYIWTLENSNQVILDKQVIDWDE